MRTFPAVVLVFTLASIGCRPAAAPVAVGERPISINDRDTKDAPRTAWKPLAEMNWTTFDGKVQKLKDFSGKVVILDFWATYCPPCIEEIPHLLELQARYGDDLQVIGLHVGGAEDKPMVPEFVEKLQITYPLATPEYELTRFIFGDESAIPQTAIFDRSGKFVEKIVGFDDAIQKQLDKLVADTIAQQ